MNLIDTFKNYRKKKIEEQINEKLKALKDDIENKAAGEVIDELLYLLLKAMSLLFVVDEDYRKNIKDFSGSYVICSQDKTIDVSAIFKKIPVLFSKIDGMEVKNEVIDTPTTTVTFKDGKAMANFLLSGNPDVIEGMLNNQLSVSGNLNYLFKFIYMLQLIPERLGINDFKKMIAHHT